MVEFKDLAGLSKPLRRLIEVIAEGIGGVSRSVLIRRTADAKSYEIRAIAAAIAESQKLLGPVTYADGKITILSTDGSTPPALPDAQIDSRVISRMAFQEAKKQQNLEKITQYATGEFGGSEEIGPDRPDSDWTARFFRIAEDITTEQMQALWGKVLAGEVKRPGSFSLRALDVLKNISQKEAETFVRVARIAVFKGKTAFIPNPDQEKALGQHCGIRFSDLLLLREIGLIAPVDLKFSLSPTALDSQTVFTCGNTCLFLQLPAGTPELPVRAVVFTEIGTELIQLIERVPANPKYIEWLAGFFQRPGVVIKSGTIVGWQGDSFRYVDLQEVAGNKPKPDGEAKPNR